MRKPLGTKTISAKELARPCCNDCGVNVITSGEYYMLKPAIWEEELGLGWTDNLCIGCVEKRLGRRLKPLLEGDDFMLLPDYEWLKQYPPSARLWDRYLPEWAKQKLKRYQRRAAKVTRR
jgi:hypothetical protein